MSPIAAEYERFEFQQPTADTVNAFRIGDTLVDTGHMSRREPVECAIREGDLTGIERVVLTHPHVDHFGGSVTVPELADLPHVVHDGAPAILNDVESNRREVRGEVQRLAARLPDTLWQQQEAFFGTSARTERRSRDCRPWTSTVSCRATAPNCLLPPNASPTVSRKTGEPNVKLRERVPRPCETTARDLAEETLNAGESTLPFLTWVAAAYRHYVAMEGVCTVDVDADGVHTSVCDQR